MLDWIFFYPCDDDDVLCSHWATVHVTLSFVPTDEYVPVMSSYFVAANNTFQCIIFWDTEQTASHWKRDSRSGWLAALFLLEILVFRYIPITSQCLLLDSHKGNKCISCTFTANTVIIHLIKGSVISILALSTGILYLNLCSVFICI